MVTIDTVHNLIGLEVTIENLHVYFIKVEFE